MSVRRSETGRAVSLFPRPECDEDTLTNDTSATELVRDAPDSDRRRKTEKLAEAAEKREKPCAAGGGGTTQTEAAETAVGARERKRARERKGEREAPAAS